MTRALSSLAVLALGAGLALLVTTGGAPSRASAATQVVVELTAPPLARADGPAAVRRVETQQRGFVAALRRSVPGASVHWRYRLVANGLAVVLPAADVPRLGRLPGVRQVFGNTTYHVLAGPDAATIRARELTGSQLPNAGAGIKIGIIDDGVDQRHAFFDAAG